MIKSNYFYNSNIGLISELCGIEFHLIVESVYHSNRVLHDELLLMLSQPEELDISKTRHCEILFCIIHMFPELINLEILQLLKSFLPLFDKILEEQQLNNIGKFIVFYTMFKVYYLICKVFDFI